MTISRHYALTPAQLEKAARGLCHLRGVDPDESIIHAPDPLPNGWRSEELRYSPRWERAALEVTHHQQLHGALSIGMGGRK